MGLIIDEKLEKLVDVEDALDRSYGILDLAVDVLKLADGGWRKATYEGLISTLNALQDDLREIKGFLERYPEEAKAGRGGPCR